MEITPSAPEVGIHWLSITLWDKPLTIRERLSRIVSPHEWTDLDHGFNGYQLAAVGQAGAKILWSENREDVHVILPGEVCERFGAEDLVTELARLTAPSRRAEVTRIDIAVDVPKGTCPTPSELWQAWNNDRDSFRTHSRRAACFQEKIGPESPVTSTFCVGSRSSDSYIRCYDRREGYVRFELESKRDVAADITRCLHLASANLEAVRGILLGAFRRALDFVESGDACATRRPLVTWWARVLDGARLMPRREALRRTIERATQWVRDAVAPTLGGLLEWFQGDLGRLMQGTAPAPRWLRKLIEARDLEAASPVPF